MMAENYAVCVSQSPLAKGCQQQEEQPCDSEEASSVSGTRIGKELFHGWNINSPALFSTLGVCGL